VKNSVFFWKNIVDDSLKALSSNEMKDILNQSNFLAIDILPSLRLVLLPPSALRFTPHEISSCLVSDCPG